MKRILAFVFAMLLIMGTIPVLADDLEVQIIGGPDSNNIPMTLDDLQIGNVYTIDGYANVKPVEILFIDYFAQFNKDADYGDVKNTYGNSSVVYYQEKSLKGDSADYYKQAAWKDSGLNADFFWLQMDVTNLQKKNVAFLSGATVKVVYDEEYEFNGWMRQANFDYNTAVYRYGSESKGGPFAVLDPSNEESIDMMYTGTYIFGCTLPNAVVEDTKTPLKIVITLDDNELTYNIRK